ncbi:MAG: hypothetical protein ACYS1A_14325 [Planctomycetota bacterium]|jgi:hypothetical protein
MLGVKKKGIHMQKEQLLVMMFFVCITIGGCPSPVSVEPLSFSHEDEIIQKGDFIVLADRRVFTVMAFMNASGFDEEATGKQMHPIRVRVREDIHAKAAEHAESFNKWKRYYQKNAIGNFCYLDYALSLSDDYPFKRIRPDSELGYPVTAKRLADFPALLNEFWVTLEMDQIWAEVKPDYLAQIHRYDFDRMDRQLAFVWDYLRLERRDQFTFVSVPNFLDRHYHAIGAHYENYWYMVESPGAGSYGLNVHEYLHSIINLLVESNYDRYDEKLNRYFQAGKDQPLAKNYGNPVTYAYECLVRAISSRIRLLMEDNPATTTRIENRVSYLTNQGLILVQPFYELLVEYEQSELNFEEFLPNMLEKLPEYDG